VRQRRSHVIAALLMAALLAPSASAVTRGSVAPVTFAAPVRIATGARLKAIACPTTTFCLAVGSHGEAVTSVSPAGGATEWSGRRIDGGTALVAVSCPSPRMCVVLDAHGRVLSANDPGGRAGAWRTVQLDLLRRCARPSCTRAPAFPTAVDCPTARLCVVIDTQGDVFTSTHPTVERRSWHRARPTAGELNAVSCASARLCVATTPGRWVIISTRPTGGARAWRRLRVLPDGFYGTRNVFGSISCPAVNFCLGSAADGFNVGLYGTRAPTTARTWATVQSLSSPQPYTNLSSGAVSCGADDSCAAYTVDQNGADALYASNDLTTWRAASFSGSDTLSGLSDISCAGATLCVAVTNRGDAVVGTAP
jgi:hypothetical protein